MDYILNIIGKTLYILSAPLDLKQTINELWHYIKFRKFIEPKTPISIKPKLVRGQYYETDSISIVVDIKIKKLCNNLFLKIEKKSNKLDLKLLKNKYNHDKYRQLKIKKLELWNKWRKKDSKIRNSYKRRIECW